MLEKTRGVVLNYIKYRESSIIVRIYTEAFGMRSYIVNSVRKARAKQNKIALFQPLSLLDLVVYEKPGKDLNRISEVQLAYPLQSIPFDVMKSSVALFITEVLGQLLKHEQEANEHMFQYLYYAVQAFDQMEERFQNFHLQFLLKAGQPLGLGVTTGDQIIAEVIQWADDPTIAQQEKAVLEQLRSASFGDHIPMDNFMRRTVLAHLLRFYQEQVHGFGQIQSLAVLKEVLS
ncbi:DNA repair protein RecO [Persicobacter psychrovividus]|uniref:DNA repair protein RecO n=1 Tax=Persicobacter psychrovividus TaxID=387638 RepID=A0ABN6L9H3_9BACT|nr:DNA repair protein RecO [Persicobacter psychrovividus]